ncbi:MAG: alpha/beta hydrolase [Candidatus Dormibacteraeota bacterium]|nr:alpha/beta hydrolase [Candidatus Dormibacteraeota bacterium]MBV9526508.1 alpha/beta hydrolase [Candidatus Dormibacteraeota bacterium]
MDGLVERVIEHDGRRLRYLTGGQGPPMLLCHGFIGSAENFGDWFPALLPRRTVVVPDLPGFGASSPLHADGNADGMARAALAVADHVGLQQYDLAGLCLGASVALGVQRSRPRAVQRMVLHTPLLAPWLTRRRFHLQAGFMLAPGVFPGIVWLSRRRIVSDLYKRLMVEGADVDPAAAQVNFDNQRRADARAARAWLRDGLRRDELSQMLGEERPTLVLVAAGDRIVDVSRLRRVLAGLSHVQLAVIEEGGHAWTQTMIEQQARVLAAFLDGLPLPRTAAASAA